jgi:hypothetical protein
MSAWFLNHVLFWCTVVNYGVLLAWFLVFRFGRAWLFSLHSRWFKLTPEGFDLAHYSGMVFYKVGILLFNLVPFVVSYVLSH